jgi:hypothetical protein
MVFLLNDPAGANVLAAGRRPQNIPQTTAQQGDMGCIGVRASAASQPKKKQVRFADRIPQRRR